jgi:hypothetical protein
MKKIYNLTNKSKIMPLKKVTNKTMSKETIPHQMKE